MLRGGKERRYSVLNSGLRQYYPAPGLIVPLFAGKRGTIIQGGDNTVLYRTAVLGYRTCKNDLEGERKN